jgi:hypothetical protein
MVNWRRRRVISRVPGSAYCPPGGGNKKKKKEIKVVAGIAERRRRYSALVKARLSQATMT